MNVNEKQVVRSNITLLTAFSISKTMLASARAVSSISGVKQKVSNNKAATTSMQNVLNFHAILAGIYFNENLQFLMRASDSTVRHACVL